MKERGVVPSDGSPPKKNPDTVHVLIAFTDPYLIPALVLVYQIHRTSSRVVNLYCYVSERETSQSAQRIFVAYCTKLGLKVELKTAAEDHLGSPSGHIASLSWSRLMPEIWETDLCWLDLDLLLKRGWDSVFDLLPRLDERAPFAMATDKVPKKRLSNTQNMARLSAGANYGNAGVLLLSYRNWISSKMPARLLKARAREEELGFEFADQCALNYVSGGKQLVLPERYNSLGQSVDSSEILIHHFAGPFKPWLRQHRHKSMKDKHGSAAVKWRFAQFQMLRGLGRIGVDIDPHSWSDLSLETFIRNEGKWLAARVRKWPGHLWRALAPSLTR
jgi:lipopolysaccharide biosynthesis glycosyltransferase